MPRIVFASAIARWRHAESGMGDGEWAVVAEGRNVRELFDAAFRECPTLRNYVLDERGALRHHVVAYLNGEPVRDKARLDTVVEPGDELYVFQALSGG